MNQIPAPLVEIGRVRSSLTDLAAAPRQGDEDAPGAWIDIDPGLAEAVSGLRRGDEIVVITWLHMADREVLTVHPRDDRSRQRLGVFATRSPDRPNPLGLHRTTILDLDGTSIRVDGIEAIDGTPVVDVKPVLDADPRGR